MKMLAATIGEGQKTEPADSDSTSECIVKKLEPWEIDQVLFTETATGIRGIYLHRDCYKSDCDRRRAAEWFELDDLLAVWIAWPTDSGKPAVGITFRDYDVGRTQRLGVRHNTSM